MRYGNELLPLIAAESKTDRHSLNLFRWVKKHRKLPLFVAHSPVSFIDGSDIGPFDETKTRARNLYVGYGEMDDGSLFGSRLSEILGAGARAKEWAFCPDRRFQVVDNWWERYIENGKCFIDPQHSLYRDKERWEVTGTTRLCRWCGQYSQQLHTKMVEVTEWR